MKISSISHCSTLKTQLFLVQIVQVLIFNEAILEFDLSRNAQVANSLRLLQNHWIYLILQWNNNFTFNSNSKKKTQNNNLWYVCFYSTREKQQKSILKGMFCPSKVPSRHLSTQALITTCSKDCKRKGMCQWQTPPFRCSVWSWLCSHYRWKMKWGTFAWSLQPWRNSCLEISLLAWEQYCC